MKKQHDVRIDRRKLHPWLDYKLGLLLKECEKQGIYLIITEGFRSKEYQDELYAKGRTKPGPKVTNATGSSYSSQHQWGIAFDFAINDKKLVYNEAMMKKVAEIAKSKKVGLKWGGDWKSPVDTPHLYLGKWGSTPKELKKLYGTFDKFKKTWTSTVKKKSRFRKGKVGTSATIGYIPKGEKVKVLWTSKLGYAKICYGKKYGFVQKSNLS